MVDDPSDLETANAIWRAQRFISPDGKRQDAASCYLHPALQKGRNLRVLLETQVTRILFDGNKATGVEFKPNPLFHPEDSDAGVPQTRELRAKKLVIVTCGAIATPALLERSGVGEAQTLRRAGVPVVADLPGVGHGYEDHQLLLYGYKSGLAPEDTLDSLLYGQGEGLEDDVKARMLGWNAQDVQGRVRPSDDDIAGLGPEFQAAWDEEYKNFPEKPLALFTLIGG